MDSSTSARRSSTSDGERRTKVGVDEGSDPPVVAIFDPEHDVEVRGEGGNESSHLSALPLRFRPYNGQHRQIGILASARLTCDGSTPHSQSDSSGLFARSESCLWLPLDGRPRSPSSLHHPQPGFQGCKWGEEADVPHGGEPLLLPFVQDLRGKESRTGGRSCQMHLGELLRASLVVTGQLTIQSITRRALSSLRIPLSRFDALFIPQTFRPAHFLTPPR